jgi:TetR/AcrR family transcriptional repressor of uid operon
MLSAAETLIERHGFSAARMRDIARAANVSYQTLYNYFPTKASILAALLTDDIEDTRTKVAALIESFSGNVLQTLHAINEARFNAVSHRQRDLWREVCIGLFQQRDEASHMFDVVDAAAHEKLLRLFQAAQRSGDLQPNVDATLLAHTLFGFSEYAFVQYVMGRTNSRAEVLRLLHEQTELLVRPYLNKLETDP